MAFGLEYKKKKYNQMEWKTKPKPIESTPAKNMFHVMGALTQANTVTGVSDSSGPCVEGFLIFESFAAFAFFELIFGNWVLSSACSDLQDLRPNLRPGPLRTRLPCTNVDLYRVCAFFATFAQKENKDNENKI